MCNDMKALTITKREVITTGESNKNILKSESQLDDTMHYPVDICREDLIPINILLGNFV